MFQKLLNRLKPGDSAVIAGKIDPDKCDLALQIERINQKGATVLLDTQGDALKRGVAASPWLIKPNEEEFCCLTGSKDKDISALAEIALQLNRRYHITHTVVSLGERGALFTQENEACYAPAVQVEIGRAHV